MLKKKSIIKLTPYFSMYNFTFYLRYCNSNTYRRENRLYSHRILLNYIIINIFTVLLSVYLIEGMIEKYKMKEKLQRAEKFYIASELASIAHEIHNPLTTVHGFTQLLNENMPLSYLRINT